VSDQITQYECREMVTRMSKEIYGNGKPGLIQEMRKLNEAIIGDLDNDGLATIIRRMETKPRDRMLRIKDVFYISLALISIAGFVFKYFGG